MKVSITYDDTLYQLVPKEATDEMLAWTDYGKDNWRRGYKLMLSAAPTPPAQPAERMPLTDEQIDAIDAAILKEGK